MDNNQSLDALDVLERDAEDRAADNAAAVREEEEKNRPPVFCLGMEGNTHVLYSLRNRRIHKLSTDKFTQPHLLLIDNKKVWTQWLFPARAAADEHVKRWELEEAAQERIFSENAQKTFDPLSIRARGIWKNASGWIYNAGNACWRIEADGNLERVENVTGGHVYSAGVALPAPADVPLTDAEGENLLNMFTARPWSVQGGGELLAGWIVSSLLAGSLKMSPHVWITAPAFTGKTALRDDLWRFLNPFATSNEGVPTEASVRQRLQGDALPWMNDEMEGGDNKKAAININNVINLMRSASYGTSPMSKGGADGTARLYPIKCGFAFFSVVDGISRDSDSSRCLRLSLTPRQNVQELWVRQEAGRSLTEHPKFHSRLIARILRLLPIITRNVADLTDYLRTLDGVDVRKGELFATLMTCRYALTSSEPLTVEQRQHAAEVLRAYDDQDEKESDSARCLSVLLNHQIDVYNAGRMSAGEAIRLMSTMCDGETKDNYRRALQLIGLRWREDLKALQVTPRPDLMKRIYKGTQWNNGKIAAVLAEGADRSKGIDGANLAGIWYQQAKVGGITPVRCVMIPSDLILNSEI